MHHRAQLMVITERLLGIVPHPTGIASGPKSRLKGALPRCRDASAAEIWD